MIELRELTKNYGLNPVLCGVDLHVANGEFVTLVGANGGKSLLLSPVTIHLNGSRDDTDKLCLASIYYRMTSQNIYELLAIIRQRPSMFLKDKSLTELELYLHGYCACLKAHGIVESNIDRPFHPHDFAFWLDSDVGWSGSRGFAYAINKHTSSADEAFDRFFELIAVYRDESHEVH